MGLSPIYIDMALHLIPAGLTGGYTGIFPLSTVYFTPPYKGDNAPKFFGKKNPKR